MQIRKAKKEDIPAILELIIGLAVYENEPDAVENPVEGLTKDLFESEVCECLVCEQNSIIGFALYYTSYSTWKGPCIYLEDLYVLPEFRQFGVGSQMFDAVVNIAKERGVKRMDWLVLDWNEPAIEFYKKKGATLDAEWLNGRLYF